MRVSLLYTSHLLDEPCEVDTEVYLPDHSRKYPDDWPQLIELKINGKPATAEQEALLREEILERARS